MSLQTTPKNGNYPQPLRALALLFLMLCLLISCPLKRELRSVLLPQAPVEQAALPAKTAITAANPSDLAAACAKTIQSLLKEASPSSLAQDFDFKNPVLFLVFSLAAFYLSLVGGSLKTGFPLSPPAGTLAAKVPLFLRHRQLVI